MVVKSRNISNLIENQLPEFISSEYPKFVKFLQKYYEQLENSGQPLDIIQNLSKYHDIDTYENSLLSEKTILTQTVDATDTTIYVNNTSSFPDTNGYILINDEVIFYQSKTSNSFEDCYRNVSATTKLGDLYNPSTVRNVPYEEVGNGSDHGITDVYNISNLFFYAFVKNYEAQYLASFPEENLKPSVDRKTLIKNIKKFYQSKGTEQSIKFIFNSIVAKEVDDIPSVYYPKDFTFKSSTGDWISNYSLKVRVLSGDVTKVIGQRIVQAPSLYDTSVKNAFSVIDNIIDIGNGFYEVVLSPSNNVGEFKIASETKLTKLLLSSKTSGNIDVFSTFGWQTTSGQIVIGNEVITYKGKNVNQFEIDTRGSNAINYAVGTPVYSFTTVSSDYADGTGSVAFLVLGVLYNLDVKEGLPYSQENDVIQESKPGFDTRDPIIFNKTTGLSRWFINQNLTNPSSPSSVVNTSLSEVNADVSAIFEDEQYYYITSSSFPSTSIGKSNWSTALKDQKILKLIRKTPLNTTEIYPTTVRDVGMLVDGSPIYSYKDYNDSDVIFGGVENIIITSKGKGYKSAPYVLIEEKLGVETATAKAVLAGEVVDSIIVESSGNGYFPPEPTITITSGRGAVVEAVVTLGRVTSLKVINRGEYYSTPPEIKITDTTGKGRFARFTAQISEDGKLVGFVKENEGKFYTQENIKIEVVPVGNGATAYANVKRWKKDRFAKLRVNLDSSNGYFFENINSALENGYAVIANPKNLRNRLGDTDSSKHSPILGYAYDGNPIYGPYGYLNSLSGSIGRLRSSYRLKNSRKNGPPLSTYPIGTFVEDYEYVHLSGELDENGGRYCTTPEYPNGVYAYFVSVDENDNPVFPYLLGNNFYSIPVDSNYNKQISQNQIPRGVTRYRTDNIEQNGKGILSLINSVYSGSISSASVFDSHDNFSVGSLVEVNYEDTQGYGLVSQVSSVQGKTVNYLENKETPAIQIETNNISYLFEGDTLVQNNTGATGQIIGNVFDGKKIVLRNITGTFNFVDTLFAQNYKVISLIVDKSSSFTANSVIKLTNGKKGNIENISGNTISSASHPFTNGEKISFSNSFSNIVSDQIYYVKNRTINSFQISSTPTGSILTLTDNSSPIAIAESVNARGKVLEATENKNTIKILVTNGEFIVDSEYFLTSSTKTDTVASKISLVKKLSEDLQIFALNDNIAIVSTNSDHNLAEGDTVNVSVDPDLNLTTTTYYVRKRIYQKVKLNPPNFATKISDTGIGILTTLNSGADYANGGSNTFTNVELLFLDQTKCRDSEGRIVGSSSSSAILGNPGGTNNAKATINVVNGLVTSVIITSKGTGYKKGDILTVSNTSLNRASGSVSSQYFITEIDHVGLSYNQTTLYLKTVEGISINDNIIINNEVVKVTAINSNASSVTIIRAQENTEAVNHYNDQPVTLYNSKYNLSVGYEVGTKTNSGKIKSYNSETQELIVIFDSIDSSINLSTINRLDLNYTFFDESTARKLVSISQILEDANYQFEFSKDQTSWRRNPIIEVQKYYTYVFDQTDTSLVGSILDFSPSNNHNLYTVEVLDSPEISKTNPGVSSPSAITKLRFGYGSAQQQFLLEKSPPNYSNYYYYDRNGIIQTDNSYLKLIDDPLQGNQTVSYVTPNKFVYKLKKLAQYDGHGTITYTTSSSTAVGKINQISISNPGKEFKKIPIVIGIRPSSSVEALAEVNWNSLTKNIDSVKITSIGKNYSKPKAIIVDGDGLFAEFKCVTNNDGAVTDILVINKGKNYTYRPKIKIIESDIKVYFNSKTIGVPKNITVIKNGYDFNNDTSIIKKYSSVQILILNNFGTTGFSSGETIVQYDQNVLIAKARVTKGGWRNGSNILRLESVEGIFRKDLPILGQLKNTTADIVTSFATLFNTNIKSYYDNLGYYQSERSRIGSESQRIADSYFYQDYSYTIKSKTPVDVWRKLINNTVHPAGFKVFGEVTIDTKGSAEFKPQPTKTNHVSFVQLWDPNKNRVTVESTRRTITQSSIRVKDVNEVRAKGSAYVSAFDTSETISYEFGLDPAFDGYVDESGNRKGTKTFTMKIKGSNTPLNVDNQNNVIISLDGIVQEPGKAFTINGTQITFNEAPFGNRFNPSNLTAINPISSYQIKLSGVLNASLFSVGQKFYTDSTSYTNVLNFVDSNSNTNPIQLQGAYEVVDIGNNTLTISPLNLLPPVLGSVFSVAVRNGTASFITTISVGGNFFPCTAKLLNYTERSYVPGSDIPGQKFIGRFIKFKDALLNSAGFRKIKNISSQFDNSKTIFDLYYDDNTPVELKSNENLLVSIDGVIQRSGFTPLVPFDRAYYIRKTVVPNQIVFVEPPRKFEEVQTSQTFNKVKQSFFAYNIGAYDRLKIDEKFVDDLNYGPFILRSAITGKTSPVDDDRNALVFIDGVLQRRNTSSYVIRGASITFGEPIRVGQKVDILYLYGRDSTKYITLFNFERVPFYNRLELKLKSYLGFKQFNKIPCYQGPSLKDNTAFGYVQKYDILPDGKCIVTLDTQNNKFDTTKPIICIDGKASGLGDLTILPSDIISIGQSQSVTGSTVYFEQTQDTLEVLRKDTSGWLINSSKKPNYYNLIDVDDEIKIDGETDYRKVLGIPDEVIKTQYRGDDDVNTDYFGKVSTTNYNGIARGEGLDVVPEVDTNPSSPTYGQIVALIWNKRNYDAYETRRILPRPAGYGYDDAPRLHFVPQPVKDEGGNIIAAPSGGGARGYVVVDNGEVVDVVLTTGGSEYKVPPRIYVARGFNIKKSNKNNVHRLITQYHTPFVFSASLKVFSGSATSQLPEPPIIYIETFVSPAIRNRSIVLTNILQIKLKPAIPLALTSAKASINFTIVPKINVRSSDISHSFISYSNGNKTPIQIFNESSVRVKPTINQYVSYIRTFLKVINGPVYPALHDTGAWLQISLTKTDSIVYIADTSKFTYSGRLMIDGEILRYTSKISDRFLGVTRGQDGTSVATHDAGTFVRQYRENVTIVSGGVAGVTIIAPSISTVRVQKASLNQVVSIEQITIKPNVVKVGDQITSIIQKSEKINSIVRVVSAQVPTLTISKSNVNVAISKLVKNNVIILAPTLNIVSKSTITKLVGEVVKIYKTGIIDSYSETILLTSDITTRTGTVTLNPTITSVSLRSSGSFSVNNTSAQTAIDSYSITNAGTTLGSLESWKFVNVGSSNVSGFTIQEFDFVYPGLKLQDFVLNKITQYTPSNIKYNAGYPSINELGSVLVNSMTTTGTTIQISSTSRFPSSGYLIIEGEIISYTGKTSTNFTGVIRSVNGIIATHANGTYLRSYN
jgi:hypothetical protein